jgi:hypothetical protein
MKVNSLVSLNTIRLSLESAKGRSASAESHLKTIEGESHGLRKGTLAIETYEARHDADGKDVSDEGKAAVKALSGIAAKQQNLQGLHRIEESDRRQLGSDLGTALGASRSLSVPAQDKASLLNAISSAQQTDQSGNWNYQALDTALYAADLQLPTARDHAAEVAGDSKSRDVSLKGEFLQQGLERLAKSYGDATSAADRSELSQDRVGSHLEVALREVDRLENRELKPFLEDQPFLIYAARERALNAAFGPLLAAHPEHGCPQP